MPLINEVNELRDFVERGYDRVGRLESFDVSVTLDDQHAFLYHRVKAYFESMEEQSLYYYSPSPAHAPLIPYVWFSVVQLLWGHGGEYREGAAWTSSSNLGILGVFSLYDLSTGSFILDTALGLFMNERIDIDENTYPGNGRIILPRLLPTLLL